MTIEEKDLICFWFKHIEQLATDKKTLNGFVMKDQDCLDEIRCKAKNCTEFIELFYNNPVAFKN